MFAQLKEYVLIVRLGNMNSYEIIFKQTRG